MTSGGGIRPEFFATSSSSTTKAWTADEIRQQWSEAEKELRALQRSLEPKAGITALQLRMALQLAGEEAKRHTDVAVLPADQQFTRIEIHRLWRQSAGELRGFQIALRRRGGPTADQLDMVLQLADREFVRMFQPRS